MKILFTILFLISFQLNAQVLDRKPASIKSFDGFTLDAIIEAPSGVPKAEVKKVIIFIHGSGPQTFDEDLSEVTEPKGTKNLFFRDLADVFLKKDFATIRYNKRAFEVKKRIEANPKYKDSPEIKPYVENPYEFLVKDVKFFIDLAKSEFPKAKIYLLGHSEGTGVALRVAHKNPLVEGVMLIGFTNEPITSSILEQVVYRSQSYFRNLDINQNNSIEPAELSASDSISKSILQQKSVIDGNQDGSISLSEFNAGNYSNIVLSDGYAVRNYLVDEARQEKLSTILKESLFKSLFLQGEYDNQTQAYFAKSIELVNKIAWKKTNFKFVYFPKAGHALDPRSSPNDLSFHLVPIETLNRVATEAEGFFKH